MGLEHRFYLDTTASRHELRDTLAQAGIGFEAKPDLDYISKAVSEATNVAILVHDLSKRAGRPDNGVWPTRRLTFGDRKLYLDKPEAHGEFGTESVRGIMALLKAYPEADAYWEAYDAAWPVLLRRKGRLVLSQALTESNDLWDAERQPFRALVDLPYTVEPLGPWKWVPIDAQKPERPGAPAG